MTIKKSILLLLMMISIVAPLTAQTDNLEVRIAFIGPADALYSWWGHVAIIIENRASGASKFYDYGNFSFNQDSFVQNFIMGRLYFLKIASNPDRQLRYNKYLNRDITIYTLDISREKKIELYKFLENDILPENRIYLYDHFYDNCSTRIRDEMDLITDGEFNKTYDVTSDKTLRMQLRRSTCNHPFMDWLLNFALNGKTDRPATELEGMYLPIELERGVASMMITGDDGSRKPLVKEINVYNRAEGRREIKDDPPPRWPIGLAIGIILGAAAWFLSRKNAENGLKRNATTIFSAAFSILLAVPGTLLFFMACFTDHYYTYWNMNLLFVSPFLFVTFVCSIHRLARRDIPMKGLYRCWSVTAAGAVLSVVLKIIPFFQQDNWETLLIVLPAALVLSGLPVSRIFRLNKQNL